MRLSVRTLASYYMNKHCSERDRIRNNLKDFCGPLDLAFDDSLMNATLSNLYDHFFEKLLVGSKPFEYLSNYLKARSEMAGLEHLDSALSKGKGVLAVSTHWGAIELMPVALLDRGYPLSIIMETSSAGLARKLFSKAKKVNAELIIESSGARVLVSALDALKRGRILFTQCDEVDAWRRRQGQSIRLFNRDLFFDHTLDFIAKKTDAAAVGVFSRRMPGERYRMTVEAIEPDESGSIARPSMHLWERYYLEAPEQGYQWKKWHAMLHGDPLLN